MDRIRTGAATRGSEHLHFASVYDNDEDLAETIVRWVCAGLSAAEHVVLVATPAHCAAVESLLTARGVDVDVAAAAGAYLALDAAATLARFHRDGRLDEAMFEQVVGGVLDQLAAGGHTVRAFGEMVALLWADGDAAAAVELEEMWNRLGRRREFALLCAYPRRALQDHPDLSHVDAVCRVHARLFPPPSYADGSNETPGNDTTRTFIGSPAAVMAARRWVASKLTAWGQPEVVDDASLVASELATNAIRHAGSAFRVDLHRTTSGVKISFEDLATHGPTRRPPNPDDIGGRGVPIVETLAVDHGHTVTPTGKIVWAELQRSRV